MSEQDIIFRDRSLFDVSEQASLQDWLPMEILQISKGCFHGRVREIIHTKGSVFFECHNCTVHKRGIIEDDLCTVSFVPSMAQSTELRFSEHHFFDRSLFFLPRACEFDVQVSGDIQTVYFRFSQSLFLERARALNPVRWERDPSELLAFDSSGLRYLDDFAMHLYSSPLFQTDIDVAHADTQISSFIMDYVLMGLNSSSPGHDDSGVMTRRRARRVMRSAIEYIEAEFNRHHCPSIVDICQQINVCQSTLQYSFQEMLGLTPNTYLRYLRLNRAHAELAHADNAETMVTNIAISWHFFHLGRFASDYLQLFGELPSTTLKRALS